MSESLQLRMLDASHGPAMLRLNRACPIEADFTFVFDRDPRFHSWPDAVFDAYDYVGGFHGEELCAYALVGFLHGLTDDGPGRYCYVGDARVAPAHRGGGFLHQASQLMLEHMPADVRWGYLLVKEGNAPADRIVRSARLDGTEVSHLCGFEAANLLLLRPSGVTGALTIRRATSDDLPALDALQAEAFADRLFAPPTGPGSVAAHIAALPGLELEHYWLAFDGSRLVGAIAAWDADSLRRTSVLRFTPRGRMIRLGWRGVAHLLPGMAPLPRPGESFKALSIVRVAVPSDDPEVLRQLLAAVHDAHLGEGLHMIHAGFCDGDPLREAVSGFWSQPFRSDIHLVGPEGCRPALSRPVIDLSLI